MSQNREEYFSKASLKERGWTDTAIANFLGEEDKKAHNHHNSRSPACLYLKSRVHEIESTPEFKAWYEKSKKRSDSAKKAAQARSLKKAQQEELLRQQLSDFHEQLSASVLDIQPLPHKELIQIVVNCWNEQNPSPERVQPKKIKLNAFIKSLPTSAQQKLSDLISNAKSVFKRYFERVQNNASNTELTKSTHDLYTATRSFIKFFNKQQEFARLIGSDLENAETISNEKQIDSMFAWLSEIIDFIQEDLEIVVLEQNQGVDLVPLTFQQVLFQHDKEIHNFQASLAVIAAQFPLVPNRYEIVSQKFFSELTRLYPALSKEFTQRHYANQINWQLKSEEVEEIASVEISQQPSIIQV
jgi:hypothetical protein